MDWMLWNAKERGVTYVKLWSDNATHFHSSMAFMEKYQQQKLHGIKIELAFFEAGEGKSDLDRHFGCIKHQIRRYLITGATLNGTVEDLLKAVVDMPNTHSIHIVIKRPPAEETRFYYGYERISAVREVSFEKEGIKAKLASGDFKEYTFTAAAVKTSQRKGTEKVPLGSGEMANSVLEKSTDKKRKPCCSFCGQRMKGIDHSSCKTKKVNSDWRGSSN